MTASSHAETNAVPPCNGAPRKSAHSAPHALPPLPPRFRFSAEFQLLLACCSSPPHTKSIFSLCSAGIDWRAFASLASRHQVTALVYTTLCHYASQFFHPQISERLKDRTVKERGRALSQAAELVRLNKVFQEQGIEMISLKGVTLSLQLFGDPAMRQAQDIDLMVRPEEIDHADQLLKAQGYKRIFPTCELTPKMWQRVLLQDHHLTYSHSDLRLMVELHWGIDLWPPQNVAELWMHCAKTEWMGTTFRQLDQDALLFFLCSHGAGHMWSRLKWLNDFAVQLAQEPASTWDSLFSMATRLDLERALAQGALLANWLLGTHVPEPLCALIRKEEPSVDLACKALRTILMGKKELCVLERFWQVTSLSYTLRLRRRLPLRVYMRRIWISSRHFSDFPLPEKAFWLYYPLRPLLTVRNQYRKAKMIKGLSGS